MFDFEQLRSFVMLVEERHFGRAAYRLFVTQPALSRRIQQLEAAVGATLIARSSRKLLLTPAGEALLPRACALLQDREATIREIKQTGVTRRFRVSLGFDGATTYAFLPELIRRVREQASPVDFAFVELPSKAQLDELAFNRLDIGLIRPHDLPDGIVSERVAREPLALAIPLDNPLARLRRPRREDIHGTDFIGYSGSGDYLQGLIETALKQQGIRPRLVQQAARAQSILSLVSTGLGIAIVPDESRRACFDNVVFRPLPFAILAELHAAYRRSRSDKEVNEVLDLLRACGLPK